tara:strand:+ start:1349 stop:1594 length:246 start_codon:yes stop_codon:yes gene_type:complete
MIEENDVLIEPYQTEKELRKLKKNDLVEVSWLFSNEKPMFGVISNIKKDLNFYRIFEVISEGQKHFIPGGIAIIRKVRDEH